MHTLISSSGSWSCVFFFHLLCFIIIANDLLNSLLFNLRMSFCFSYSNNVCITMCKYMRIDTNQSHQNSILILCIHVQAFKPEVRKIPLIYIRKHFAKLATNEFWTFWSHITKNPLQKDSFRMFISARVRRKKKYRKNNNNNNDKTVKRREKAHIYTVY